MADELDPKDILFITRLARDFNNLIISESLGVTLYEKIVKMQTILRTLTLEGKNIGEIMDENKDLVAHVKATDRLGVYQSSDPCFQSIQDLIYYGYILNKKKDGNEVYNMAETCAFDIMKGRINENVNLETLRKRERNMRNSATIEPVYDDTDNINNDEFVLLIYLYILNNVILYWNISKKKDDKPICMPKFKKKIIEILQALDTENQIKRFKCENTNAKKTKDEIGEYMDLDEYIASSINNSSSGGRCRQKKTRRKLTYKKGKLIRRKHKRHTRR